MIINNLNNKKCITKGIWSYVLSGYGNNTQGQVQTKQNKAIEKSVLFWGFLFFIFLQKTDRLIWNVRSPANRTLTLPKHFQHLIQEIAFSFWEYWSPVKSRCRRLIMCLCIGSFKKCLSDCCTPDQYGSHTFHYASD